MSSNPKKSRSSLQAEMELRFLHGLSAEWEEAILHIQDIPIRRQLRKPTFSLSDMTAKWAYWSSDKREICLSRELLMNYSWATVREILHHEMAHQLAHEVLGGKGEKSHGPTFQRACLMLRANPMASGTYPTLEDRIHLEKSSDEDRLMSRIQKLMALAESSNQHEAELAMTKANELMIRFNISFIQNKSPKTYESIFVGKPALRHSRDQRSLSVLLYEFYYVECIWLGAYVLEKQKMGTVLELSGTPQNLKVAEYVYYFVQNFIQSQWEQYKKKNKVSHHRRVDFAEGIIEGFRYRLKRQRRRFKRNCSPEEKALIDLGDPQLKEYIHNRFPRLRTFRRTHSNPHEHIVNDGRRVGQNLVISKGVTNQSTQSSPLMIPSQ